MWQILPGQIFEGIYPTPKVIEVRGFSRARRYGVYAESAYIFCTGRVVAQWPSLQRKQALALREMARLILDAHKSSKTSMSLFSVLPPSVF